VAVVPRADEMNASAQNVLLKTLEEPPGRALLLLLAERPGKLLPTVLSRCRTVRFAPVAIPLLERALVLHHGFEPGLAHEAAFWAEGDFRDALRAANPEWREFREKVTTDLDRAVAGTTRDWLAVSLGYEKMKSDFEEEEDLTDAQLRRRSVQNILKTALALWSKRMTGASPIPENLKRLKPQEVSTAILRHMEILEGNLPPRMVLDHLFLTLRQGLRTGEVETRSFFDLSVI